MMKVLLAAPQSKDTTIGKISICCRRALEKLGYDFMVFDYRESRYLKSPAGALVKKAIKKFLPPEIRRVPLIDYMEKERMNKALLETIEGYRPDILLVIIGECISARTFEKVRKSGIIVANWTPDTLLDPLRRDFFEEFSQYYDYFFIIDSYEVKNYVKINSRFIKLIPLACDPEIHKTVDLTDEEKKRYGSEITFSGQIKYRRGEILSSVTEFNPAIWGDGVEKNSPLAKFHRGRYFFDEEGVKIYNASDMVLDINTPYEGVDKVLHYTNRAFEASACGALLLTNENPYLSGLYNIGEEIVCYRDKEDLKEKIRYYLSHPEERKAIARRGQERTHRDHTYEKRLKEIFSIIEKNE